MADQDQDKKTTTIDDLVKQLSNKDGPKPSLSPSPSPQPSPSQTRPQPPANLPGVKIPPSPAMGPTRPSVPQPSLTPNQSKLGTGQARPEPPQPSPVKPLSPPLPSAAGQTPKSFTVGQVPRTSSLNATRDKLGQASPSPIKEYKSSIRTMGEDISSIKSGQKPTGVDVPRKIMPEQSKVEPEINKSAAPSQPTGPRPLVGLGRSDKTGPLPTSPTPKKVEESKPPGIQPPIIIPSEKKMISTNLYIIIAGVLVVGGFLYWLLILRAQPEVVLSPTPSPTQTVTPTPTIRNLDEIFEGDPVNFEILLSESVSGDFKTFINTLSVASAEFLEISLVEDVEGTLLPLDFLDMFNLDQTTYPAGLSNNIVDSAVLAYGQSETFNADGTVNLDVQDHKITVFVARVRDKAVVEIIMRDWELTITDDLANYLSIKDTADEASVNFLDNLYRGVSVRYKNFPFPDVTVDYSIVDSSGQSYLVISGSREATFAAIDILLDQ